MEGRDGQGQVLDDPDCKLECSVSKRSQRRDLPSKRVTNGGASDAATARAGGGQGDLLAEFLSHSTYTFFN